MGIKRNVCLKCRAFCQSDPEVKNKGECRRHAPTQSGWPVIYFPGQKWCMEFLGGTDPVKQEGVDYFFEGFRLKVTQQEAEALAVQYPDADLYLEFQKMAEWLDSKDKKLTKPITFIRNWLDKTRHTRRKDLGGELVV